MCQKIIPLYTILQALIFYTKAIEYFVTIGNETLHQLPYFYLDYLNDINSSAINVQYLQDEKYEKIDPENTFHPIWPYLNPNYLILLSSVNMSMIEEASSITGSRTEVHEGSGTDPVIYGLSDAGVVNNIRGLFPMGTVDDIQKLHDHLFIERGYNKDIIPVNEHMQPLQLEVKISLLEVTQFDTINEELIVVVELETRWNDYRLRWDPDKFGQVHKIDYPFHEVWTPNIGVFNDNTGQSRFSTEDNTNKAEIWTDGYVFWHQIHTKQVKCSLDMKDFPFDIQHCTLVIDSLTDQAEIDMVLFRDDDSFIPDEHKLNVWSVVDSRLSKNTKPETEKYCNLCKQIRYTIILKRKSLTYVFDMIVPCTLLAMLSGFSLWIEAGHDSRLQLNLSVMVAISVYQLIASENLPKSDVIPRLTLYLFIQNLMVFSSLCITLTLWQAKTFLENIKTSKLLIPRCIYVFVVDFIGFVIFIKYDPEFKKTRNEIDAIKEQLWKYASKKLSNKLKLTAGHETIRGHGRLTERGDSATLENDTAPAHEKTEINLNKMKMRLFIITIDRFFAVAYLIVLVSMIIWMFVTRPDDDKRIEEIWREQARF